jgi:hypothetical protein
VTHFSDLPEEILAEHSPGNIVFYPAYTSTSKKSGWMWGGKQVFTISSPNHARDKSMYNGSEGEVLIERNTSFKILKKSPNSRGGFNFEMIEADSP